MKTMKRAAFSKTVSISNSNDQKSKELNKKNWRKTNFSTGKSTNIEEKTKILGTLSVMGMKHMIFRKSKKEGVSNSQENNEISTKENMEKNYLEIVEKQLHTMKILLKKVLYLFFSYC